jgi:hypothetical protein
MLMPSVVLALERQKEDGSSGRKLFTVDELEWFSRNAYNLALKHTAAWDLRSVVRMLTACVNIIGHFPPDIGSKVELSLKTLFAHFVISSALVALARTQDNVEKQRQDYVALRKHVTAFDSELPEYLPQLDDQSRDDMLRKHATLLAFDFEAAVAVEQWDDLGSIVQRAVPCRNITAFQAMADSLLRAQAPGQGTFFPFLNSFSSNLDVQRSTQPCAKLSTRSGSSRASTPSSWPSTRAACSRQPCH